MNYKCSFVLLKMRVRMPVKHKSSASKYEASLTIQSPHNHSLPKTKKPIIISTGMSTETQIKKAVKILSQNNLSILHCNSSYPSKTNQLNLRYIEKLKKMFQKSVVGYSGHEMNLSSSVAAVVLGAKIVERHITLDKSMWGTDQQASIEPLGFARLIKDVKAVEMSLGKPLKIVYPEEKIVMSKLRKFN